MTRKFRKKEDEITVNTGKETEEIIKKEDAEEKKANVENLKLEDFFYKALFYDQLPLLFGKIIEAYPTTNFYLVSSLTNKKKVYSCSSLSKNSSFLGVRDQSGFNVGDFVLFVYDKSEERGIILGSYYEPLIRSEDLIGERITVNSITVHELIALKALISFGIGSLISGAMNVDSYTGEFCKSTETGSMLFLDRFMSFMRASEYCGIWMFYHDYLLRLRFNFLEELSKGYFRTYKSKPVLASLTNDVEVDKFLKENYLTESFDGFELKNLTIPKIFSHFKLKTGLNISDVEKLSLFSSQHFRLYETLHQSKTASGIYGLKSLRGIFLLQSAAELLYERLREADALDGDNYQNINYSDNFIVKILQSHPSYSKYLGKVSQVASGIIDRINFYFNEELLGNLRKRTRDFFVGNKIDLFNPSGNENNTLEFVEKINNDGSILNKNLTASNLGSLISVLEDGSIVLMTGKGAEIRLEKDKIFIRAPNIFIQSGDKLVLWGGNDFLVRARKCGEISITDGNLDINSTTKKVNIHGGSINLSSSNGDVKISNQTGFTQTEILQDECPHILLNKDTVKFSAIKSKGGNPTIDKGRVVISSQEIYINGSEKVECAPHPVFANLEIFAFSCPEVGVLIPEPLWYRIYTAYGIDQDVEFWEEISLPHNSKGPWGTNSGKMYTQQIGYTKNTTESYGESGEEEIKTKWPVLKRDSSC